MSRTSVWLVIIEPVLLIMLLGLLSSWMSADCQRKKDESWFSLLFLEEFRELHICVDSVFLDTHHCAFGKQCFCD